MSFRRFFNTIFLPKEKFSPVSYFGRSPAERGDWRKAAPQAN
jgi:hypothetical protein